MTKIKTTVYLHSDKESMIDKAESLGITNNEAISNFAYCCYEVGVEIEVDTDTGDYKILGVKE